MGATAWVSSRSPPRSRTCRRCTCRSFRGPHQGCREAAIDGHEEIGRRCRALGVDTIVVFDVHWLVNSEYHINCGPKFEGVYTSNELPHFIKNMPYAYPGQPGAGPPDRRHGQRDGREEPRALATPRSSWNTARWCRCAT